MFAHGVKEQTTHHEYKSEKEARLAELAAQKEKLNAEKTSLEKELKELKESTIVAMKRKIELLHAEIELLSASANYIDITQFSAIKVHDELMNQLLEMNTEITRSLLLVSQKISEIEQRIYRLTLPFYERFESLEQIFNAYLKKVYEDEKKFFDLSWRKSQLAFEVLLMPTLNENTELNNTAVIVQQPPSIIFFDKEGHKDIILTRQDPNFNEIITQLDLGHYFTDQLKLRPEINSQSLTQNGLSDKKINNLINLIRHKGAHVEKTPPFYMYCFAVISIEKYLKEYKQTGDIAKFYIWMKDVKMRVASFQYPPAQLTEIINDCILFASEAMEHHKSAKNDLDNEWKQIAKMFNPAKHGSNFPADLPFELDKELIKLIQKLEDKRKYINNKICMVHCGLPSVNEKFKFERNKTKEALLLESRSALENYRVEKNAARLFVIAESIHEKNEALKHPPTNRLELFRYDPAEIKTNDLINELMTLAKAELVRNNLTEGQVIQEREILTNEKRAKRASRFGYV